MGPNSLTCHWSRISEAQRSCDPACLPQPCPAWCPGISGLAQIMGLLVGLSEAPLWGRWGWFGAQYLRLCLGHHRLLTPTLAGCPPTPLLPSGGRAEWRAGGQPRALWTWNEGEECGLGATFFICGMLPRKRASLGWSRSLPCCQASDVGLGWDWVPLGACPLFTSTVSCGAQPTAY